MKAGGLGDVVGALPAALRALGHDVRIVLPRYGFLTTDRMKRHEAPLGVPLGGGEAWAAVFETRLPGSDVPIYFLEHAQLFGRPYVYDPPGGASLDTCFMGCWPTSTCGLPSAATELTDTAVIP